MNPTQLRTFLTVVEHGSFSAAARTMHVSQPAVTMQIQALEADVGATLLDRQYRNVTPTEAGTALVPFARRILEELDRARNEIASIGGTLTGRLELAASTTPGQYVLPKLLGSFHADNPEVTVSLAVADSLHVVEAVENGEASLGMVGAEVRGARVNFERCGTDELVMICPPDHQLAADKDQRLADVACAKWIMREQGSGTRAVTEDIMRGADIDPGDLNVVMELGTGEAVVNAVEGGLGVSVVSAFVAEKAIQLGSVATLDVGHFPVGRPLFLVEPRTMPSHAASAFAEHVRDSFEVPHV